MQTITTVGLDIAKSVFQVNGIDVEGKVIVRRQLKRRYVLAFFQKLPPCLVGIEVCASSQYWCRVATRGARAAAGNTGDRISECIGPGRRRPT
jgi:transposase